LYIKSILRDFVVAKSRIFIYKFSSFIYSLSNPRAIAKTDKLFQRDWDIVFLLLDFTRFNAEKLLSTDADVGGRDTIKQNNLYISGTTEMISFL
jgi:hypothetical protein